MIAALLAGLAAGYGIAIPVGAVSVLIVETGLRAGFRTAAAAGAGAASADGIYASIAAVFGAALAGMLMPWQAPLRAAAVVVLAIVALRGFRSVARDAERSRAVAPGSGEARLDGTSVGSGPAPADGGRAHSSGPPTALPVRPDGPTRPSWD